MVAREDTPESCEDVNMTVVPFPTGQPELPAALSQRFEVRHLIERAWLADVYAVHDQQTRQEGVLKVFRPPVSGEDISDKLLAAIQEASLIKHPTFVRTLDFGHVLVGGAPSVFTFSEAVPHPRLDEVVDEGMGSPEAGRMLVALIDALHEARRHGSHLALHPGNVFVCATPHGDRLRITDFGQHAGAVGHLAGPASQNSERAAWVPPELLDGREGSVQSDVWCIGALLRFMTTGTSPNDHFADMPTTVSRIVRSAMATDPAFRYEDLAELKIALEALVVNETFDGYLPPAAKVTTPTAALPLPTTENPGPSEQQKAALIGAGLLAVALALIGFAALA